jgi:hypothetical protein
LMRMPLTTETRATETQAKHICKFRDCGNGWLLCSGKKVCGVFKWDEVAKTINVFGEEEIDSICTYQNCYHKFSLHGHRSHQADFNCVCNHPTNPALGINKKELEV